MSNDPFILRDATPEHYVQWSDRSCVWALEPRSQAERFALTITSATPLEFAFALPIEPAESLHLRFATWARRNTASVICELLDHSGASIRRLELSAGSIQDGEFTKVADLRGLPISERPRRIRLTSPRATHENGFAIWLRQSRLGLHKPVQRLERFRGDRFFLYPDDEVAPGSRPPIALVAAETSDRVKLRLVLEAIDRGFPGSHVRMTSVEPLHELWTDSVNADVVFLTEDTPKLDDFSFELHRRGICTIFVEIAETCVRSGDDMTSTTIGTAASLRAASRRRCRFTLLQDGELIDSISKVVDPGDSHKTNRRLQRMAKATHDRWSPAITVISPVSGQPEETSEYVERCFSQSYPGSITVVLIGTRPPISLQDAEGKRIDGAYRGRRRLVWVDGWREAIAFAAENDMASEDLIVLSQNGRWSPNFLAAHALEHFDGQDAIVIGDTVLQTGLPLVTSSIAIRNDQVQANGFLNCACSNVSFPRRMIGALEGLVEALVINDPVRRRTRELGCAYDAYVDGRVFLSSQEATVYRCAKPIPTEGEALEFPPIGVEQLLSTRPGLALVARRWLRDIEDKASPRPIPRRGPRVLNILSYRWHAAHQYELHKLPHNFTMATSIGENRFIDRWSFEQRPLRSNVRMRPSMDIDPADYDLAILHFDENVYATELSNGRLDPSWGEPFAWLLSLPSIPKIAICHGTPAFVGQFAAEAAPITKFEAHEAERRRLVKALAMAGAEVVCNSWQALEEWSFHSARVIWHGFDPQEFPPTAYEGQVLALKPDMDRPHYRGVFEMRLVAAGLGPHVNISTLSYEQPPIEPRNRNGYAFRAFRAYVDQARRSSTYLNTTLRSPMPRSRGEAMMMGLAPICIRNHDVERFIDQGVNGFYAEEAGDLAQFINHLFLDPERVRRLGQAARRTALDVFNHDRFLAAWTSLIEEVT